MADLRVFIRIKNNLILRRAEELLGDNVTLKDISELTGVSPITLSRYINFKDSPISCRNNQYGFAWKPTVEKIAKAFNCLPEDLFPEHFRDAKKNLYKLEIDAAQLALLNDEERIGDPHRALETQELREKTAKALASLTPREEYIIRQRIYEDLSYYAIAEELGVSHERIRQIEHKAMRKLRHPSRSKSLQPYQ